MRATFVAEEVGSGLRRNLTMTLAVIITVAVSLALFGASLLVSSQVSTMKDFWYDKVEVSIFLCGKNSDTPSCAGGAVTQAQRDQINSDLESLRPLVEEIYYESQEEAFARFKEQFANSPIVENVTANALPESFRVKLSDPTQYDVVASAFAGAMNLVWMAILAAVMTAEKMIGPRATAPLGLLLIAIGVGLAISAVGPAALRTYWLG